MGKSGDHFTFLQGQAKMTFPEALQLMRSMAAEDQPGKAISENSPFPYELLARVAEVWQQDFRDHSDGINYLENRGIQDRTLLEKIQAGYCDGQKLLEITTEAERQHLQRVGVLNERGREFFARCVVFPLQDRHGRRVGFYGRSTVPSAKVPHHQNLQLENDHLSQPLAASKGRLGLSLAPSSLRLRLALFCVWPTFQGK